MYQTRTNTILFQPIRSKIEINRVFPRLARVPRLPELQELGTDRKFSRAGHGCLFSRAGHGCLFSRVGDGCKFSRAWRRPHIFASNSHWFIALLRLL